MPNETSTKKRLSATVYYLLTGLIFGWLGLLATTTALPQWRNGTLSAWSLAVIHELVLGFMLTVAFGVLYQIIPIAFQAPAVPRHVLRWHLPLHLAAVLTMSIGFVATRWFLVGAGGAALLVLTALYLGFIGRSYLRARNRTPVHRGLVVPAAALALVMLLGLLQAFAPQWANAHVVRTHALLGGLAFWGGLVLVFSYKLVPMFVISHGYTVSLRRTAAVFYAGALLWTVAAWMPAGSPARAVVVVAAIVWAVSLALYVRDMIAIVAARKKRRIVRPMYHAFAAMAAMVVGMVGMGAAACFSGSTWAYPAVFLFAFGGFIPLMYAYMQKIVPFLWFEYRFSKRPERKTAPLIDDMVPDRAAQWAMGVYGAGVLAGLACLCGPPDGDWLAAAARASGGLMTLGSIILFFALRHVLTIGGPRPDDEGVNP
ncbi:MAG: hypothetical protein K6T78_10205 [Alicyclobacillus sp.]|nr:hypothetical protein [Alicyclobacillus sp.]